MSYVRIGRQSVTVLSFCSSVFCWWAQPRNQGFYSSIPGPSPVWGLKGSCGNFRGSFWPLDDSLHGIFFFFFFSLCCCTPPPVGAYSIISCPRHQKVLWTQGNLGERVKEPLTRVNVVWGVLPRASHFTSLICNRGRKTLFYRLSEL